jgi:hypothetical protein
MRTTAATGLGFRRIFRESLPATDRFERTVANTPATAADRIMTLIDCAHIRSDGGKDLPVCDHVVIMTLIQM